MGCGSSTAKPAVDEPLAGVMPGGGSAPSAASNPRGSILGGQGAAAAAATAAAPPVQPKKKVVLYDPLTSPFPPSATSLQRKVAGRAPLLQLEPYAPEWRRIPEVLLMQQQRKLGIVEDKEEEEASMQEEAAADGAADDADNKPEAAADAGVAPSKPATPAASVFSSSTHEDNVIAGPLGDAHVIAALVSLAAHPNRLARLFRALDPPADAAAAGKSPHIAGLVVGSHLPSSSVAKVALAESGPRFAASAQSGTYEVRLFYGGLWRTWSVDDTVPVTLAGGAGPQPLFCSSRDGTEFWMMLVEKALARACGSYEDLMLQTPAQLFRMLTGGSAETMQLPRPASAAALADGSAGASTEECDKLWAQLQVCWSRSDLLAATTRELSQSQHAAVASSKTLRATRAAASHAQGESAQHYFLHDHAELGIGAFYSVLDVQSLPVSCGGARLVLFRNPGGSQHFDGRWSEGSAEWKALEAAGPDGSGAMHAARLRLAKKKHVLLVSADAASSPFGSAQQQQQGDGIFWLDWEDVMRHFGAIFICSVLADQYDHCYVGEGRWEGKSAAGSPPECVPPPGSHPSGSGPATSSTGVFVHNPTFRIRNTSAKRSPPLVITLSKGAAMCAAAMAAPGGGAGAAAAGGQHARGRSTAAHDSQQQQAPAAKRGSVIGASLASATASPATVANNTTTSSSGGGPVHIGFRIVTNQLTHSLNCNAPVSSPTFGLLQLSPLHDLVASSALSGDSAVSLTLPALMPYVDYFLVPYTAAAGVEADFVATIWSQSGSILFDRCAALPNNPLELALEWKRSRKTAGGNVWSDAYLSNPVFKVVSSAPEGTPVSLLFNLVKTSPSPSADGSGAAAAAAGLDANVNMALLTNTAPHALSTTAIGCVSAPAKPGAIGTSGAAAAGGKKAGAAEQPASADDAGAGASVSFAVAAGPTKKGKTLLPVVGVLSPWHEVVPGGCTRVSEGGGGLYSAQRAYAMVVEKLQPGREHFLLASQFLPGGEGAALLQVYSSALEHVSVERVDPRGQVVAEGRWAGVNAAGPARRKKTYLNNPQFCLRHQAPTPMSVVVSLQFLGSLGSGSGGGGGAGGAGGGGGSAEASFNIAFCTYPSGSADPNPYTAAEKEEQKRRRKDGEKRSAAAAEDRKKRDVAEKKAAATAQEKLTGKGAGAETSASAASASAAASAPSFGVASLRIKTKDRAGGSSKKKEGQKSNNNMFGNLDADGADAAGEDGLADGGGGGGGVARVNPLSTDYELLAQTSHSGDLYRPARLMHLFIAEVVPDKSYFIVPSTAVPGLEGEFELRVFGGQPGELRLDPCFLNSAGDAIDMSGLASRRVSNAMIAGLASHKVKKVEGTGKSGSTKPKKKH